MRAVLKVGIEENGEEFLAEAIGNAVD